VWRGGCGGQGVVRMAVGTGMEVGAETTRKQVSMVVEGAADIETGWW